MTAPPVITVDFETYAIRSRPAYPPKPVGVAIRWPGRAAEYYGQSDDLMAALGPVWESTLPLLFHNAKFDLAVAYECMGLPRLPWDRVHDTMFLAYLYDPHARSLGLKPLAEDILRQPPDERNVLDEWIWANRAELERMAPGQKVKKSQLGAWIWAAPVELVAPYAIGDVNRTAALFAHLWPIIQSEGMGRAYDRERQLCPILMENEEQGMRCDLAALESDIALYTAAHSTVENALRERLQASGLNFDSDRDVANVLLTRDIVPREAWKLTESGQMSMSKEALLPAMFTDPLIASALGYRNRLQTCLKMFMQPWQAQAAQRGGWISTNWNQVRGASGGGTRTGRPSTSDPNFLNISKDFDGRTDGYVHPEFLNVPRLPLCRKYILPDEGHVFLHRDFDGQELRVFAHFEQGALWAAYRANPKLDPHKFVGDTLKELVGVELERMKIKVLNFQALYGGGAPAAQRQLHCTLAEARQYKAFHDKALPGRKLLNNEILRVVRSGQPIRTWGGRLYRVEKPRVVNGELRRWDYKLINYLCQGSAADITKEAIIAWYAAKQPGARFLVTIYDEIDLSVDKDEWKKHNKTLRECMDTDRLAVPMRSSGKVGPCWGKLETCE